MIPKTSGWTRKKGGKIPKPGATASAMQPLERPAAVAVISQHERSFVLTPSEKSWVRTAMATTAPTAADAWNANRWRCRREDCAADRLAREQRGPVPGVGLCAPRRGLARRVDLESAGSGKEHTIEQEVDEKSRSGACKHLGYAKGRRTQFHASGNRSKNATATTAPALKPSTHCIREARRSASRPPVAGVQNAAPDSAKSNIEYSEITTQVSHNP